MSFSLEFQAASADDAAKILGEETQLPDSIRAFIVQALQALPDGSGVSIKADGHLFNNDYQVSNATLMVRPVKMRVPKEPAA